VDLSANGSHVRLTRDVAAVTMDLNAVETANLRMLGGTDAVTVNDLTGTGLTAAGVDLSATGGGGDGAADTVTAFGTGGADTVTARSTLTQDVLTGFAPRITVTGAEPADNVVVNGLGGADTLIYPGTGGDDTLGVAPNGTMAAAFLPGGVLTDALTERLVVQGLSGNDTITANNGLAGLTQFTLDGGAGDDTLRGGDGDDTVLGGTGNDLVDGGRGNDVAQMGDGTDTFQWDPGDGSDTIDGQNGFDTLNFNGSNIGEHLDLSANGARLRLTRDVAAIVMDAGGVEKLNLRTLGSADTVTVNDLTGTGLTQANLDLSGAGGGGDGAADTVVVNGTPLPDTVNVFVSGPQVRVAGLAPVTAISGSEPGVDVLQVNTLGGDDTVTVGSAVSQLIIPLVDLGPGG
jgi:Ca2+-binding RTX toxin-like protein